MEKKPRLNGTGSIFMQISVTLTQRLFTNVMLDGNDPQSNWICTFDKQSRSLQLSNTRFTLIGTASAQESDGRCWLIKYLLEQL